MSRKKIIAFINGENEVGSNIVVKAEQCCFQGADEIYVFNFSKAKAEREEFLTVLKQIHRQVDIPFTAGMYVERFEDAKRAFYTGADKLCLRYEMLPSDDVVSEMTARFGTRRFVIEINAKENFELLGLWSDTLIVKHVDVSGTLDKRIMKAKKNIIIRDSLMRNDLQDLFEMKKVSAVATNYYENKSIYKIKHQMRENGIDLSVFEPSIAFDDFKFGIDGLIPCIVQDYRTNEVLQLAYMNKAAFDATVATGKMTYYSRSRRELWCKGETSGHYQYVKELSLDCDKDTLLAKVHQIGAACHTGEKSCFFTELAKKEYKNTNPLTIFTEVMNIIKERKEHPKEGSYTTYLFDKGLDKILKKCGEEAAEILIAAKNQDSGELTYEIADFLYHMMVLMAECGVNWDDVMGELANRPGNSR
ncbi:MAG: bifunctional phosphoribosyl-AMP cyclohydrolase/phosphoribosyl-ATP diphosphatase HisIE [Lachnoclostridium sp.]|jgi:phosphoribosyl-ATP pyrophosphohydrolase/phosphoribosyl-AMP cyclohydrolase|nr:bifunctional phosphoribosyl-AMP cyclohydrolase/phosphoribosyl-ATP diphosphatase HisIE [Lachnoclostridium sp.]